MAREHDEPGEPDEDDAALSWAGDEEQGRATSRDRRATLAEHEDDASDALDATTASGTGGTAPDTTGRGRTLLTGVFGGLFLAYTVGWILAVQTIPSGASDLFGEVMWQFGEFLAIIAAGLWFAGVVYLTRDRRSAVRFGWLAVGLVALVPWPVIWRLIP